MSLPPVPVVGQRILIYGTIPGRVVSIPDEDHFEFLADGRDDVGIFLSKQWNLWDPELVSPDGDLAPADVVLATVLGAFAECAALLGVGVSTSTEQDIRRARERMSHVLTAFDRLVARSKNPAALDGTTVPHRPIVLIGERLRKQTIDVLEELVYHAADAYTVPSARLAEQARAIAESFKQAYPPFDVDPACPGHPDSRMPTGVRWHLAGACPCAKRKET